MLRLLSALPLLFAAAPVICQTKTDAPLSAADIAAYDLARSRGYKLFLYDQAAWHGTDDMMVKLPDWAGRAAGYVIDGAPEVARITFFDRSPVPKALYVGQFKGTRLVSSKVLREGDDTTLDPGRLRLIAAREQALTAFRAGNVALCAKASPNIAVLPPEKLDGPMLAYLMTPQTDANVMPFGGHYRVEIAADGTVGPIKRFSTGCLDLGASKAKRGKVASLVVSQILDPLPTEIHFFAALALRTTIAVATPNHPHKAAFLILNPYEKSP